MEVYSMKKTLICIGLVLAGLSTGIFADEIQRYS